MPMFRNAWFSAVLAAACITPASLLASPPAEKTASGPEILMYVLPECGYCVRARDYLRTHGLTWNEIDISVSDENREAFAAAGGRGTPLILIDDAPVHGFNEEALARALAAYAPTPKGVH